MYFCDNQVRPTCVCCFVLLYYGIAARHVAYSLRPTEHLVCSNTISSAQAPELLEACSISEDNELRQRIDDLTLGQDAARVAAENIRRRRQLEEMWKARNAERTAWKVAREDQARVEALNTLSKHEFRRHRPHTAVEIGYLWERLQSVKKRAGGIGLPYQSYDKVMEGGGARAPEGRERLTCCSGISRRRPIIVAQRGTRAGRERRSRSRAAYLCYDDIMEMGMARS